MKKFILFILIITAVISGYRVFHVYQDYQKAYSYYTTMQEEYIEVQTTITPIISNVLPSPTPTAIITPKITTPEPRHTTIEQPPIQVDFNKLQKQNKEVIGWIYSENTIINYPILQTSNNIYYLRHLMNKTYSASGSIFMDSINNNIILYGHHMRNGSMFASLEKYKEQEYFNIHNELWLLTPTQNYKITPFAGLVVSPSREDYFITNFNSITEQNEYIKFAINNSTFQGIITPNNADKLITLTTCDYTFENAKFILLGILIPVVE